ncbi:DUF1622 domain-containing protein [Gilvimarinus sp. F26214L]|uniref:DUF1622 domain-containing protein n=1 Tax=Gilvimarinus sp. DZF01 TaxID=3461371 RepID=UPI00404632E2
MSEILAPFAEATAATIELLGILVILGATLYSLAFAGTCLIRKAERDRLYHQVRQRLGSGILLGLEFLVAADIIHTVAVDVSASSVGLLAAVLLIRTFLSFSLELELTGRWPWQKNAIE